ncbi:DNA-processing protein DprA [Roseibium salinum]|uniref:DNA-processing protein DprA n=1 Tax=Roseibium salinum TaxID=1604349 RepID=A0ABT3R1H6_9HYPH|nr:DNA-processing protein DprA [Roseibium sp. DSM 29163]MCX2723102.1 DNA-processing protein DprA [Roseibium sp. DSM 29163]
MSGPVDHKMLRLSDTQRLAWLRLIRSENIGPATFFDLVNHTGSAERALEMLPELSKRGGKKSYRLCPVEDAEAELAAHGKRGARLVALGEADYPPHLRHIDSPPPLLSVKGSPILAHTKMLGIVGARNASLSGRKLAGMFARDLGAEDFVVISGLARGIDAAAHDAALPTGTVAVFAGGIDVLYPPEHNRLLAAIFDAGGAVISEMPLGWKPRGRDFPRRNRLISGCSSGSSSSKRPSRRAPCTQPATHWNRDREIFAVPGSPLDPRSEGANGLIRQGAMLVTSARDVLEGLSGRIEPVLPVQQRLLEEDRPRPSALSDPDDQLRQRVMSALGPTPIDLDELIRFVDGDTRSIHVILLELELAGRLERHRGNKISALM